MIKLTKKAMPTVLKDNADKWLQELKIKLSVLDTLDKKSDEYKKKKKEIIASQGKYNHPDVKSVLRAETHDKCAYCEGVVTDVGYGDIEHISPKVSDVDRTFDWSNLGFSCPVCNRKKAIVESGEIVDPYTQDPTPYIQFCGHIASSNGNAKGWKTIQLLGLNRTELVQSRIQVYNSVMGELEVIKIQSDLSVKNAMVENFVEEHLSPTREFSAMRASLWKYFGLSDFEQ